jgi:glycosyltransferase involved in cell wall biosynthesis
MKRVLFVDHVNRILGGAEINLIELLARISRSERWVAACACPCGSNLSAALAEVPIAQWDYGFAPPLNRLRLVGQRFSARASMQGLAALRSARQRLQTILAEFRPSACVSCTNKDHFCVSWACRRARIPSIWWLNDVISSDFFPWPMRVSLRWWARQTAARVIVVSNYARDKLVRSGWPPRLVATIHNGLPLERYARCPPGQLRRLLGLAAEEPLIGMMGRLAPWKGPDFFLRLAQAWIQEAPQGHFVLIGQAFNEDQEYAAGLRRFVTDQGLAARVHFVPFQSEVNAALSDLEVFIHTSIKPEPFGRVIIEAMAVGLPVIAARAGGVPEIVNDGVNGLLAEPGNLPQYLAQLRRLLGSASLRKQLSQAAQQSVGEKFSLERVQRQFMQVIDEVGIQ